MIELLVWLVVAGFIFAIVWLLVTEIFVLVKVPRMVRTAVLCVLLVGALAALLWRVGWVLKWTS